MSQTKAKFAEAELLNNFNLHGHSSSVIHQEITCHLSYYYYFFVHSFCCSHWSWSSPSSERCLHCPSGTIGKVICTADKALSTHLFFCCGFLAASQENDRVLSVPPPPLRQVVHLSHFESLPFLLEWEPRAQPNLFHLGHKCQVTKENWAKLHSRYLRLHYEFAVRKCQRNRFHLLIGFIEKLTAEILACCLFVFCFVF